MILCFMGASCTGKSTAAEEINKLLNGKIYSGKDYMRLAKNKEEAEKAFQTILEAGQHSEEYLIYVISENEDLKLIPENTYKVLFTTELDIMKERFAKRMNGNLPAPVGMMLERKANLWKEQKYDLLIESNLHSVEEISEMIMKQIKNTNKEPI